MANEITSLPLFEGKAIRTEIAEDGSVLFCAKDVCDILGYKDAQAAVAQHCLEKGTVKRRTLTKGGEWELADSGKKHGDSLPFTNNGHSGFQILWRASVVGAIEKPAGVKFAMLAD